MPEFLAEAYAPRGAADTAAPAEVALAAGQVSQPGAPVRFPGAIAVPEEGTCFYLYQAPSADAVRAPTTRARLRPARIAPAISIRPPRARSGPAAGTGGTTRPPTPPPGLQGTRPGPPHRTSPPAPP